MTMAPEVLLISELAVYNVFELEFIWNFNFDFRFFNLSFSFVAILLPADRNPTHLTHDIPS